MRAAAAWRREHAADTIFERRLSAAKASKHRTHWPTGFHKFDRQGIPVFYDFVGRADLGAMMRAPDALTQV